MMSPVMQDAYDRFMQRVRIQPVLHYAVEDFEQSPEYKTAQHQMAKKPTRLS